MSRAVRLGVCAVGALGFALLLAAAVPVVPDFGGSWHPYRDLAVGAALGQHTANAVSSVNYDLRALDTLGEELILLGSVVGATALLRPTRDERTAPAGEHVRVLPVTAMAGYVLMPVVLVIGLDVVLHGHLTPGGGFQGGVVVGTGIHLLYVTGDLPALRRLSPVSWHSFAESAGAGAFVAVGLAGPVAGLALLTNVLPTGSLGELPSAGVVPLLSAAVGCEVAAGVVVLLAQFLHQALELTGGRR